jgi:hypothetical protein
MTNLRLLPPFEQQMDNSGEPLNGGTLQFYVAGTTTPQNTFSDLALTIPNDNPIELNPAGRVMTNVYAPLNTLYDIVLKDSDGNTIRTEEDVEVTGADFDPEGSGLFDIINGDLYPLLPPVVSASVSINYTNDDWGKATIRTNAGTMTDTLPAPSGADFIAGWYADYVCLGASLQITSTAMINGAASITLGTNDFARIISTGTTYYAEVTNGGNLSARVGGTVTIANGEITIGNGAEYLMDTESVVDTDDLDTINGATDGKLLFLRTVADARDVVLKHNTGNIYNPALQDITLGKTQDIVLLRYDASLVKWIVISYQNAATKLPVFTDEFISSGTAVSTGSQIYTVAHGLGVTPDVVELSLRCITAELGYSIGDEYVRSGTNDPTGGGNICYTKNATNVIILQDATPRVNSITTGLITAAITPANWEYIVRAYT